MTLSCSVSGGYPNGSIRWFGEHETDWTASSKQHAIRTEDGRFNLNSELDLLPGSIFSKYTCAVYNSSGGREQEAQYDVQLPGSKAEGIGSLWRRLYLSLRDQTLVTNLTAGSSSRNHSSQRFNHELHKIVIHFNLAVWFLSFRVLLAEGR